MCVCVHEKRFCEVLPVRVAEPAPTVQVRAASPYRLPAPLNKIVKLKTVTVTRVHGLAQNPPTKEPEDNRNLNLSILGTHHLALKLPPNLNEQFQSSSKLV